MLYIKMEQKNENSEKWTAFWKGGTVIIPFWNSKSGRERMSLDDMKLLGAPIPSENDEKIFKSWCKNNDEVYQPSLE